MEEKRNMPFTDLGNMQAKEKLVDGLRRQAASEDYHTDSDMLLEAADKFETLLSAAEAFISEAESMGWGERSETALPGSFDALVKAVKDIRR